MWTRIELKNYAKDFLRKHYLKAFIVCLIFTLLSGNGKSSNNNNNNNNLGTNDFGPGWSYNEDIFLDGGVKIPKAGYSGLRSIIRVLGSFPTFIIGSTISFFLFIMFLISIVIGPLIEVGKNRFFLKGFEEDVSIGYLFSTFKSEEFWSVFKCMFITRLKNTLWYFLFIIPGIIKSYEYRMVPYLLAEGENLTSAEAIEISRQLTDGHKWDMFVLGLSFLGWQLLGALLFGIGGFFVTPYYEATMARLYKVLSTEQ